MHSLALALNQKGYVVTGSDDEINDPARSRLAAKGLLPSAAGWFPEKLNTRPDAIVVGMHARKDNPELIRALDLNIPVYSFPEFLYRETGHKMRVVVAGSHGKTTITAMIIHVLQQTDRSFDYLVGSSVAGLDNPVRITADSNLAIFEGDEYPASCLDLRPKFLLFKPYIALVSGIAWDHINVYPQYDGYVEQFRHLAASLPPEGSLVYCSDDPELKSLVDGLEMSVTGIPYRVHPYDCRNGTTFLQTETGDVPLKIFGRHNMQNIEGARQVCRILGVEDHIFYRAISTFAGAGRRLQLLGEKGSCAVYLDFAHSPSKVEATARAVKEHYPRRKLVACLELHTFSSLSASFLLQYRHTLGAADSTLVYFNPETVRHKQLDMISKEEVRAAFGHEGLIVSTEKAEVSRFIYEEAGGDTAVLIMTSGTFSGIDFQQLTTEILNKL